MADKLSKNKLISSEVLSMVAKHHHAHGYHSEATPFNLSVLECVFIVAHEFATELYKIAFRPEKIPNAIEKVVLFCSKGPLKQVKAVFLSTVSKNFPLN
jgi:hypothetical protein